MYTTKYGFFGSPLKTFPDHCIRGSGTDRENGGD